MSTYQTIRRQGALASLDFTVEAPADWVTVPIPDEETNFDDVLAFAPIGVVMAPYAAIVFSVAARPAYAEGAVAQWLEYVTRQRQLDPGTIELQHVGPHPGVACWGLQISDGTVMRARLIFFEDGDRLVNVSCMAPDALWNSSSATFAHMLKTFALATPRGSKAPLMPPGVAPAPDTMFQEILPPSPPPPPPAADTDEVDEDAPVGTPASAVALATDMASFEPEHPLNARLRNQGVGLVPNVLDYHDQEQWATLAPGALAATLRVPFGWHVIDDGRRTLVFDAGGQTQVNLQLVARQGRTDDAILAGKLAELQASWPGLQPLRCQILGLECLGIRNVAVDGKPIEQGYLLRKAPEDRVLEVRITSTPAGFPKAGNLAEVLLRDLVFPGEEAPALDAAGEDAASA